MSKIIKPLGDGKRRILSPEEAMRQLDAYQPPKPEEQGSTGRKPLDEQLMAELPVYFKLEWEPKAPRNEYTGRKEEYWYSNSVRRLKEAGYARHPRPAEVISLIADYLQGRLTKYTALTAIAEDILDGEGEWLSMAWQPGTLNGALSVSTKAKEVLLSCYLDPENLLFRDVPTGYIVDGTDLNFSQWIPFAIDREYPKTWVHLSLFDEKFVEFLYGRKFEDLPEEMQSGFKEVSILVPDKDTPQPVGLGPGQSIRELTVSYHGPKLASRGVRTKPVEPSFEDAFKAAFPYIERGMKAWQK